MPALFTLSSRLNSFKARPELFDWVYGKSDIRDLIRRAEQVKGLSSLMLNYDEHFEGGSVAHVKEAFKNSRLQVSGINLRYPDNPYLNGSFTNPDPKIRAEAMQMTRKAADACRELGGKHVIVWLANDGFDYPFQLDYGQAWDWAVVGIRDVAEYAPDLKVSIEYKPSEPRRFSLLGTFGSTLLALRDVGTYPNLGVTLDFCHMLMSKESPAMAAALCAHYNKLFGIHLNDGYGSLDDGLMIGSINFTSTLELLYHALRTNFSEVIYFDTFPTREDPVLECEANMTRINQMIELIERMDQQKLEDAFKNQDGLASNQILWEAMFKK